MEEIYFELPLYKKIIFKDIEEDKNDFILNFLNYSGLVNGYNPEINENTSYKVIFNRERYFYRLESYEGYHYCDLECVRTNYNIKFIFLLQKTEKIIDEYTTETNYIFQKIGQYPTIADLEIGKFKKYSTILQKEHLRELNKAIGLSANGVGIGAFVYLRRIFENLIENYHQLAIKTDNWNDELYKKSKIIDKIDLLKDYLPEVVVKFKKVYSIISKGIHELEEEECLTYFPIVKDAILAILEQDYLKRENEIKQKDLEKNISKLIQKIK